MIVLVTHGHLPSRRQRETTLARLLLADRDLVLRQGAAAEFGPQVPHWFGSRGDGPVGLLSLFGRHGERAHLRARPVSDLGRT